MNSSFALIFLLLAGYEFDAIIKMKKQDKTRTVLLWAKMILLYLMCIVYVIKIFV